MKEDAVAGGLTTGRHGGVLGEDEALGTLRLTMYGQGEDRLSL